MHDVDMQLTQSSSRLRSPAGITLVEVLLTTSLGLLTLATFTSFNRFQLMSLRNQATQNHVQMRTRNAIDLLSRDIRRAGRNPRCVAGIEAIADAKQHSLHILSDHDGDGTVDGLDEDITYTFGGAVDGLERDANGSSDVIFDADSVGGSLFRYFDADGVELTTGSTGLPPADRTKVQRVRIDVALETAADNPGSGPALRADLSTDIDLRNRFFVNGLTCP